MLIVISASDHACCTLKPHCFCYLDILFIFFMVPIIPNGQKQAGHLNLRLEWKAHSGMGYIILLSYFWCLLVFSYLLTFTYLLCFDNFLFLSVGEVRKSSHGLFSIELFQRHLTAKLDWLVGEIDKLAHTAHTSSKQYIRIHLADRMLLWSFQQDYTTSRIMLFRNKFSKKGWKLNALLKRRSVKS